MLRFTRSYCLGRSTERHRAGKVDPTLFRRRGRQEIDKEREDFTM